jgi:uncharacterized protein (DUF302 family)
VSAVQFCGVAFFLLMTLALGRFPRRLSMIKYGFIKKVDCSYEQLLEKLPSLLKNEGFGILAQIDVRETLKAKLSVDFPKYIILGVCNPPLAYKALQKETNIGLMLPCNVIVYEKDNETYFAIAKPTIAMGGVDNPDLSDVAKEAESRLAKVFNSIT